MGRGECHTDTQFNTKTIRLAYEYEYTSDGQIYKFVDHEIERGVIYEYDLAGRLKGTDSYSLTDLKYDFDARREYDEFGRLRGVYRYINEISGTSNTPRSTDYLYSYDTEGSLNNVSIYSKASTSSDKIVYSYDSYDRLSGKTYDYKNFDIVNTYTYKDTSSYLSGQVEMHTVKIGNNILRYKYVYDSNGNITSVRYGNPEIRYVYDELNRLIREDNELTERTYIYEYDEAGNILKHDTYPLTAAGVTPASNQWLSGIDITYHTGIWGDLVSSIGSRTITYDNIGNPLSYYNGTSYTFAWHGRQLRTAYVGAQRFDFVYDDAGVRTGKIKNGVITTYYYDGSLLVAEKTAGNITVYIYDAEGTPIGMQYHGASYASGVWDCYWYEKNLL